MYNWDELGSVTLFNSIVAGNTSPNTFGYNSGNGATTSGITTQTGADLTNGIPLLAPLGHSGSRTPTMPPLTEWPHDAMRHTHASFEYALSGDFDAIADNQGNSMAILRKNYIAYASRTEARQFSQLTPKKTSVPWN
jgi:hypothetical protein